MRKENLELKVLLLGWAFKKDTNDTRESAAIYVANNLLNNNIKIDVYDPKVAEHQINFDLSSNLKIEPLLSKKIRLFLEKVNSGSYLPKFSIFENLCLDDFFKSPLKLSLLLLLR